MEAKNLYVLSGTENLMRGELDNVTIFFIGQYTGPTE